MKRIICSSCLILTGYGLFAQSPAAVAFYNDNGNWIVKAKLENVNAILIMDLETGNAYFQKIKQDSIIINQKQITEGYMPLDAVPPKKKSTSKGSNK